VGLDGGGDQAVLLGGISSVEWTLLVGENLGITSDILYNIDKQ
jgi:hypothetical protein